MTPTDVAATPIHRNAPRAGTSASARPAVRRVAILSIHTSPLDQPGQGDGGGLNVSVAEAARRSADRGVAVDVFTRATDPGLPPTVLLHRAADGTCARVHHLVAGPVAPVPKEDVANLLCGVLLALERHPEVVRRTSRGEAPFDLVHAHYWLSGWVGRRIAARWQVPLVQTFHTLGVLKNAHLAPGDTPEPALRLVAEAAVARAADQVTVMTCGEAALLHRAYGLSGSRLQVVPAGVDLSRFHPPRDGEAGTHAPTMLFVGRLQPLKGPDVAVRALAAVRRQVPDARLRIIGGASGNGQGLTGPRELRALASELGVAEALDIRPAVAQDELATAYREANVLVAPSRSETFGLVALEAQASGLPVVAADVPGLQAVVGEGGVLVRGHDPADHAGAIVPILTDPRLAATLGAAGVRAASSATWDRSVDRLLAVYDQVLTRTATAARTGSEPAEDDVAV
ncbi:MAG: glycosyltransferase [Nitriliruptor sp.]